MLIVRCRNANSAENELVHALEGLDGVAFIGYTVAQGQQEREIDALVFTPVRAVAIEVKAPMLGTPYIGELKPSINAPWMIGDELAEFYGNVSPIEQAKTGAQMFAGFLREKLEKTPFVQVAVSISGTDLIMSDGPTMVGQTAVALTDKIKDGLDLMKQKPISLQKVLEIIEVMDIGELQPTKKSIEKEWKNAEKMQSNIKSQHMVKKKGKKQVDENSAFFEVIEKLSSAFKTAVIIFLIVWFLYTTGVLEAMIDVFDTLQQDINSYLSNDGSG